MKSNKSAVTSIEILPILRDRWSPRAFSSKLVTREQIQTLLEAARWAASSLNEQPWRFLVARKQKPEDFAKALSCLVEKNQLWAKHAPVLILTFVKERLSRNDAPNRCAEHDLGLAVGNLSSQATAEGLYLHQMGGILRDRIREVYEIPEGFSPMTAIAVGYQGDPDTLEDEGHRKSETAERTRKPIAEIAYEGAWGNGISASQLAESQ